MTGPNPGQFLGMLTTNPAVIRRRFGGGGGGGAEHGQATQGTGGDGGGGHGDGVVHPSPQTVLPHLSWTNWHHIQRKPR